MADSMHYKKAHTLKILLVSFIVFIGQQEPVCADLQEVRICSNQNYGYYGDGVPKLLGDCSGHGTCVENNTRCKCEEGWTGLSDIVNTENSDCQIFIIGVKVLWGLTLFHALIVQETIIPYLFKKWRRLSSRRLQSNKVKTGKHVIQRPAGIKLSRRIQMDHLFAILLFEFVVFPSTTTFGILRIISEKERIGVTVASTALVTSNAIGFFLALYYFLPILILIWMSSVGLRKFETEQTYIWRKPFTVKVFKKTKSISAVLNSVFVFSCCLPWLVYISNNPMSNGVAVAVWFLYTGFQCAVVIGYFAFAWHLYSAILKILQPKIIISHDRNEAQATIKKINKMFKIICCIAGLTILCQLVFLFCPWTWNKYDYITPYIVFLCTLWGQVMCTLPKMYEKLDGKDSMNTTSSKASISEKGEISCDQGGIMYT
mmetsp:Transcript_22819/g.29124  ORF Transcript_22819/g.29124 Transcript_22819/m.29124 type:complete len:429 (+) Transcript_22819:189-1475(+)